MRASCHLISVSPRYPAELRAGDSIKHAPSIQPRSNEATFFATEFFAISNCHDGGRTRKCGITAREKGQNPIIVISIEAGGEKAGPCQCHSLMSRDGCVDEKA